MTVSSYPHLRELSLVALDLDGTVICPRGERPISERILQAVERLRQAGLPITFVTGRTEDYALPIAHRFGVTTPMVTYNGARVFCPRREELLFKAVIEPMTAKRLLAYLDQQPEVVACYFERDGQTELLQNRCSGSPAQDDHLFGKSRRMVGPLSPFGELSLSKVILTTRTPLEPEIEGRFGKSLQVVRTHPELIELLPGGVCKGSGVERVCRLLKISPERVLAIGDQANDVSTFRRVGYSVAMGDAPLEVQGEARWVTASFAEDGCAQVLEALL